MTHFTEIEDGSDRIACERFLASQLLAEEVLDTLMEAALVMAPDFCIERTNRAFLELFHKTRVEVEGHGLFDLGEEWDISVLRDLLRDRLPSTPKGSPTGMELSHDFQKDVGTRILCLNALRLPGDTKAHQPERVLLVIDDVTEQRLRDQENEALRKSAIEADRREAGLLRDVLSCVTEGRLTLCLSEADLPPRAGSVVGSFSLTLPGLRSLRYYVRCAAEELGIAPERVDDLETAVGEAAMNAVVHGGGGLAGIHTVSSDGDEPARIQVWITDLGKGIDVRDIPRAALEKGYTTSGTMGQGFKIVLRTADRVFLLTNECGTTIVIEQEKDTPLPAWLRNLGVGEF